MADATVSDKFAQVRGFKVEIASPGSGSEVDTAWESVSGGAVLVERTNSPGHKSVGEITLRGPVTAERQSLCTWLNETVAGRPWRRTVSITPIHLDGTLGETLMFVDCGLTEYTPPQLVVRDPKDPACADPPSEAVRFTYRDWFVKP